MKTRVLRRGSVKGAYSPSSNHPFYGWHRFFGGGRKKRPSRFQHPGRFEPRGVVPVDEGTRVCGERSTTPSRRNSRSCPRAWCPSTKGQGFAGREAPRRIGGRPVRAWGRGARRRRNKGLRGEKHHAEPAELAFVPEGVVPVDERTRVCGERSTTPNWRKAGSCLGAWCPSTKEQGFAGREAPRRASGTRVWAWGRGARRRRNKGLRGGKHHAGPEEETSVLPFRSVRARPRAAPPPDGIKKRSCYSSSATS